MGGGGVLPITNFAIGQSRMAEHARAREPRERGRAVTSSGCYTNGEHTGVSPQRVVSCHIGLANLVVPQGGTLSDIIGCRASAWAHCGYFMLQPLSAFPAQSSRSSPVALSARHHGSP